MADDDLNYSTPRKRRRLFTVSANQNNLLEELVSDGLNSDVPTSVDPNSDGEEELLDFNGSDIEDPNWLPQSDISSDTDSQNDETDIIHEDATVDAGEEDQDLGPASLSSLTGPANLTTTANAPGPANLTATANAPGPTNLMTTAPTTGPSTSTDTSNAVCKWSAIKTGTPHYFPEFSNHTTFHCQLENPKPIDVFCHFIDEEMWAFIVQETNRYASHYLRNEELTTKSRTKEWLPTDISEMKKFVGIFICMGLVQAPEINLYWSKNDLYSNKLVKATMTRDRFLLIRKFWHFSNNNERDQNDRLNKIKNLVEYLNIAFMETVEPGKSLVIDETMIPWRGRLIFRQYIKNKSHKYWVKLYKLCTPEGYTLRISIYAGKNGPRPSSEGHTYDVVMELLDEYRDGSVYFEGFLDKGRVVYTDNFYIGVPLAEKLLGRNTRICGTMNANRRGLSEKIKMKVKKGDCKGFQSQHGTKIIKWTDKRSVIMLSTLVEHSARLADSGKKNRSGEAILKPQSVLDYSSAKKGVDYSDQMSAYQSSLRKSLKWYKKVALELLTGTTIVNSWIIFTKMTGQKMPILKFREEVARSLMGNIGLGNNNSPFRMKAHTLGQTCGEGRKKRRRCVVCYANNRKASTSREADKITKQVTTFCQDCTDKPFTCLPCFNQTHK